MDPGGCGDSGEGLLLGVEAEYRDRKRWPRGLYRDGETKAREQPSPGSTGGQTAFQGLLTEVSQAPPGPDVVRVGVGGGCRSLGQAL